MSGVSKWKCTESTEVFAAKAVSTGSTDEKSNSVSQCSIYKTNKLKVNVNDPPKTIGWVSIASILCCDIIGSGILTMGYSICFLGWFPGLVLLVGMCPLNQYSGMLYQRTLVLLPDRTRAPTLYFMCKELLPTWFAVFVQTLNYIVNYIYFASLFGIMAQSLGGMFYDVHWCLPVWGAISVPIGFCIMIFCRSQRIVSYFTWPSVVSIAVTIFICIAFMMINFDKRPALEYGNTPAVTSDLTFEQVVFGMNQFVFAYSGQNIYVEVLAEMKYPKHFLKSILLSSAVQYFLYLLVGISANLYSGQYNLQISLITSNLNYDIWFRISNAALFIHILTIFPITGQIVTRPLHLWFDPQSANENTARGYFFWTLSLTIIIVTSSAFGIVFPYLQLLQNLTGVIFIVPCFITPAILYLACCLKYGHKVHPFDKAFIPIICFAFASFLFIYGLYVSIKQMVQIVETKNGFLPCNCENIWDSGCPSI